MQIIAQQAQPHPNPLVQGLRRAYAHPRPASPKPQVATASVFDASNLGSPLVLDKGWRVGVTADPAAALPAFDDSSWALRDAGQVIADVSDDEQPADVPGAASPSTYTGRNEQRFAWFRLHIKLPDNHGPVALLLELPVSQNTSMVIGTTGPGVDVFANGRHIQPEGPHGDAPEHYQQIARIYNLGLSPSETSLTLAVRTMYVPVGLGSYTGFFATRTFRLGHLDDLNRALELWSVHSLFERLPRLINSILLLVLALFLLALYFAQKGHIEYLWLALHELLPSVLLIWPEVQPGWISCFTVR
jgi:hypothetical protein